MRLPSISAILRRSALPPRLPALIIRHSAGATAVAPLACGALFAAVRTWCQPGTLKRPTFYLERAKYHVLHCLRSPEPARGQALHKHFFGARFLARRGCSKREGGAFSTTCPVPAAAIRKQCLSLQSTTITVFGSRRSVRSVRSVRLSTWHLTTAHRVPCQFCAWADSELGQHARLTCHVGLGLGLSEANRPLVTVSKHISGHGLPLQGGRHMAVRPKPSSTSPARTHSQRRQGTLFRLVHLCALASGPPVCQTKTRTQAAAFARGAPNQRAGRWRGPRWPARRWCDEAPACAGPAPWSCAASLSSVYCATAPSASAGTRRHSRTGSATPWPASAAWRGRTSSLRTIPARR
mmetsp:Transcript_17118/g.48944  ORF Transcript_17118/g.48944 Transcript_17118/m.48944 type:complete len:351 (+) Transcript_17118:921-1973(+)